MKRAGISGIKASDQRILPPLVSWLLVQVLLFQILSPVALAITHVPAAGVEYTIICTADGLRYVPVDGDVSAADIQPSGDGQAVIHCPLCLGPVDVATIPEDPGAYIWPVMPADISKAVAPDDFGFLLWFGRLPPTRGPPVQLT